jgi:DNA-binding response OmpR family regulator
MRPEVAHRRIEAFGKRFGEAHLYLAYHAAFPLALTPDLLYRLWANFQRDIHGEVLNIPWIAVADLLLSSLCDEVGHELYEMEKEVRNALLSELKANPGFGTERINELSDFLLAYVRQQLDSPDLDTRDFAQAQKWTALAYSRPSEAAREIACALSRLKLEDKTEWIRMTSLVETVAEPLAEFEPLLIYIRGMADFVRGNQEGTATQFRKLRGQQHEVKVAGVRLNLRAAIENKHQFIQNEEATSKAQSSNYSSFGESSPAARILYVDSDTDNLFLVQTILEHEGYRVEVENTSSLALAKIEASLPDLIIIEIVMSEIDGYELTQRIRENNVLPFIPILLITAYDKPSVVKGLDTGANDFIRKPVEVDELLARVRSLLRLKRALDERDHRARQFNSTLQEQQIQSNPTTTKSQASPEDSQVRQQLIEQVEFASDPFLAEAIPETRVESEENSNPPVTIEELTAIDETLSQRHIELDPRGYFIIYLDRDVKLICVMHFTNVIDAHSLAVDSVTGKAIPAKGKIERTYSTLFTGRTAKELCISIFEQTQPCPVTRFDHAAYLGREFMRAEIALVTGEEYLQD